MSKSTSNSISPKKIACSICFDDISSNRIIQCPYCPSATCQKCISSWIMSLDDTEPRCCSNSCKKTWSLDFLAKKIGSSFDIKYREKRAEIFVQREKSLFPQTQELVKRKLNESIINKQIKEIMQENDKYLSIIKENKDRIRNLRRSNDLGVTSKEDGKKEKREFIRKCPVDNCMGYLSSALKCGICDGYARKYCHMPKDSKDDPDHECDKNTVASIKMIKDETRPCPKCGERIYKISGCDQMFCTIASCHTAFSWDNGTIETGRVHNPHALEIQRLLGNGNIRREFGDIPCGGIPFLHRLEYVMKMYKVFHPFSHIHQIANHIQNYELPRIPAHAANIDNTDLRIDYMMKTIDDKIFKSKIKHRLKKQEKNGEINQVLHMCVISMNDLFGNILVAKSKKDIEKALEDLNIIREYTNKQLQIIGDRFGNVVPSIEPTWEWCCNSKKRKKTVTNTNREERNEVGAAAMFNIRGELL